MNRCTSPAAVVALTVLLSGCVSTATYPEHWATRLEVKGGACPVIDGEYLNEGEYFEDSGDGALVRQTVHLNAIVCMHCSEGERTDADPVAPPADAYQRFRLELAHETLKITATTADGRTFSHEEPIRASCRDSLLLVDAGWWSSLQEDEGWELFGSTLGMSALARGSLKLGRSEDGSLLLRQSVVGSLLLFYWPILPMAATEWIRFPPATSSPEANGAAPSLAAQVAPPAEAPPGDH